MNKTSILGVALGAIALAACATAASWLWRYYTAEPRGIANAEHRIESAPSRITSYNHYFDLCASIQGYNGQLAAQQEQLDASELTDDRSRIRANIAGLKGQRSRAVAQYNADARKAYTSARFLGDDLPKHINRNPENLTCEKY